MWSANALNSLTSFFINSTRSNSKLKEIPFSKFNLKVVPRFVPIKYFINILTTWTGGIREISGKKYFHSALSSLPFSCIAVSPNLLSVIDVLHTYDDSNCSIWRRHHLVRHSLGNLMKGIFRKTCFDTLQNSKRDLSIWKHPPSTANSLHSRKSLFYIFPGSNLTLNTNIWLSTCLLSVEFKLMICQMFNLLSCNIR